MQHCSAVGWRIEDAPRPGRATRALNRFANRVFPRHNAKMSLPVVAIVGRPNVGKSSLLNCLAGRRIAIVDAMPGVTRDRISVPVAIGQQDGATGSAEGRYIELVDTGGMGMDDSDGLTEQVEAQIAYAVEAAALILFVVDVREGVMPPDRAVADRLRKYDRHVILVANKVDHASLTAEIGELHALGFGEPVAVSAKHSIGLAELLEAIDRRLGDDVSGQAPARAVMKLAIVGKRNAGKSTFINALAGQERVIVSEKPGTTRDSVDVTVELDGRTFTLIDTAGVRKRRRVSGDIDFYGQHRALRSIRRADVVALMIDASVPVSQVDRSLAGHIAEHFKPVVLVVNKWDLARGAAAGEDYAEYFAKMFPELSFAPLSLTAATEGANVRETIGLAEQLFDQAQVRVGTGELNAVVEKILKLRGPSHPRGTRPPKILYVTQIAVGPPTIVCFVNDVRSFEGSYRRFLLNQFRARLPFSEVLIRLVFRQRSQEKRRGRH